MISCADGKHGYGKDALPWIVVNDVRYIKCTDDVSYSLMDAFDDRIGLRVPICYRFPFLGYSHCDTFLQIQP